MVDERTRGEEMTHSFEQFDLKPFLIEALKDIEFNEPTEIQREVIPVVNKGRNVIGQSQTGSGKSHSFLLPILNRINPDKDQVQAVITAPSRELAEQLYEKASQLAAFSTPEIIVQNYVGGTDKSRQLDKLAGKQPHIAIGTPGRLNDLIKENALLVYKADVLVVDEADMTLDMGFLGQVDQMASSMAKGVQMLVFSATIPEKLQPFLKKYTENPVFLQIGSKEGISDTVENWLISTKGKQKLKLVHDVLTMGEPFLALVFANTKTRVDEIADYLKGKGLKVATIHGDIPPRERRRVMKQVQNLDFQFVVATDLAARGIDIEGVSHVINVEIPKDLTFFVHRVGRTARNKMSGISITFYEPGQEKQIEEIEKMGIEFMPKRIKNKEVVDTYDRNRRNQRDDKRAGEAFDTEIHGMRKKMKKNIKPGYKRKIKRKIDQKKKRLRRNKY